MSDKKKKKKKPGLQRIPIDRGYYAAAVLPDISGCNQSNFIEQLAFCSTRLMAGTIEIATLCRKRTNKQIHTIMSNQQVHCVLYSHS